MPRGNKKKNKQKHKKKQDKQRHITTTATGNNGDNNTEEHISFRIKDIDTGDETVFKGMIRSDKMSKVFKEYAIRKGVDESSLRFTIGEEHIIQENDTPLSLDLNDDDLISAVICVSFRLRDIDTGEETPYTIRRSHEMSMVFQNYADLIRLNSNKKGDIDLRFLINGDAISPTDTPDTLKLKDGVIIDVKVENDNQDSSSSSSNDSSCYTYDTPDTLDLKDSLDIIDSNSFAAAESYANKSVDDDDISDITNENNNANALIRIIIKGEDDEEGTSFKINRTSPMSKVFKAYARGKGVEGYNFEEPSLRFTTIDDKLISHDDTPESLQLEDSCQIIAKRCNDQIDVICTNQRAIEIQMKDKAGEVIRLRIKNNNIQMLKVFKAYAKQKGLNMSSFHFLLDGESIQETDTPLSLGLEDEDEIDVVINDIVVEGCGINEMNGVYRMSGINDDVPKYVHQCRYQGKEEEFTLFRRKLMDESRKWYISLVPPDCNPGTTEGVDFYAADCHTGDGFDDSLPPESNWMTFGEEAGSPPSRVYHNTCDDIDDGDQQVGTHDVDIDDDSTYSSSNNTLSVPSVEHEEWLQEAIECSHNTCSIQPEALQNQNPDEVLMAFDKLTLEQKNDATATAENRTDDPLKEWTPPPRDECPICFIPLPIDDKSTCYRPCCGMIVCKGCIADQIQMFIRDSGDEMQEEMIKALNQCMFCRSNMYGKSDELNKAAAENNRPMGMLRVAERYLEPRILGTVVRYKDKQEGLKWLKRATVLGCGKAAEKIGDILLEDENEKEAYFYFNKATELGRVQTYVKLGNIELNRGEVVSAMDNYRKAAICGVKDPGLVQILKRGFMDGYITRDEYFSTLYKHYKANDEMNSESRKRALYKW